MDEIEIRNMWKNHATLDEPYWEDAIDFLLSALQKSQEEIETLKAGIETRNHDIKALKDDKRRLERTDD